LATLSDITTVVVFAVEPSVFTGMVSQSVSVKSV